MPLRPDRAPVPPWALALTATSSVQLGSALSVHLISAVGPAGTAWLRLSMGAIIFLVLTRPPLRAVRVPPRLAAITSLSDLVLRRRYHRPGFHVSDGT